MLNTVKDMRLETKRLIIRPYVQEDLMECFQLMQDKELFVYMDMDVMNHDEYTDLFTWLIDCYDIGFDKDFKYSFNITLKENGRHLGWCGLGGLHFDISFKEIFYLIGKDYWGNGYAKEATQALLDYGFRRMNLNEIVAIVQPDNNASKKVIEHLGLMYKHIIQGLPEKFNWNNGELFYSLSKNDYLQKTRQN